MNSNRQIAIEPIGMVRKVSDRESELALHETVAQGLHGLKTGSRIDVLYWMHRLGPEDRQTLEVHPRGDKGRPLQGVFSVRSPMRPNPIGVSAVEVVGMAGARLRVAGLDAQDGSPILDIKAERGEDRATRIVGIWGQIHDAIMRKIEEQPEHGTVRDLFYRPVRQAGREAAESRLRDAAAIGRRILEIESLWNIAGRVMEETPDRFVREVTVCPWSGLTPLTCRYFAWWMEGFVEGSNPDYRYRLQQLIPEGAPTCVWQIERAARKQQDQN